MSRILVLTAALLLSVLVFSVPATAGTPYQINLKMSENTIDKLQAEGFILYGFKASKGGSGGAPTVWFSVSTDDLTANTNISWEEDYKAYVSESTIANGIQIESANDVDINLGQTWQVKKDGFGNVVDGSSGEIGIYSVDSKTWTTGVEQKVNGQFAILCAFPLFGNMTDFITPIEKVLLLFSTQKINTGTVIEDAVSSSVLVDLTGEESRDITFDIDQGWACGGFNWCPTYPPNQDLQSLLIDSSNDAFDPKAFSDLMGRPQGTCYGSKGCRGTNLGTYDQNKCYSKSVGGKSWKASSGNCYDK